MLKKRKVLYYNFTSEKDLNIVDSLYNKYEWNPVFMCGQINKLTKNWIKEKNLNCHLVRSMNLRLAKFDYSKIGKPVPIDNKIIDFLSKYSLHFLGVLQDTTGWNYSYEERKSYYYEILQYWNTVINNIKPDLFISRTWPHLSDCYSLYLICKYYNINFLCIDPYPQLNSKRHCIINSLEKLHYPISNIYLSNENLKFSPNANEYVLQIKKGEYKTKNQFKNTLIPLHMSEWASEFEKLDTKKLGKFIIKILKIPKIFFTFLIKFLKEKNFISYSEKINWLTSGILNFMYPFEWKNNKKPYYFYTSRLNFFEEYFHRVKLKKKNKKLKAYYESICVKPDFNKPYLFFAAPYQPEAATLPHGGYFENLFLTLDILTTTLPKNWNIYFKEHYSTFWEYFRGCLARDKHYYKRLLSYSNVKLISINTDQFKLIDKSKGVVSVCGTPSWEAAVREKPSLSFGRAWYHGCKSIFVINSVEDSINAINKIKNGFKPEKKDIERYVAALEKVSFETETLNPFDKDYSISEDSERTASEFYNVNKKFYENKLAVDK